jgi:putative transposase
VHEHRHELDVQRLCRLAQVSRSGYYAFLKAKPSQRALETQRLDQLLGELFRLHKGHAGYRMLQSYLLEAGFRTSRNRVRRRMRHLGLKGRQVRAFKVTTNSHHALGYAENRLGQAFTVERPNQVWVGDITYLKSGASWLYLATVIDLYARRVVGWALDSHMRSDLICHAFDMAKQARRPRHSLMFHSDRGAQYASCYDNAVAESFFKTLKTECASSSFKDVHQARSALFAYIELFYNTKRHHSFNGYLSPQKKELLYWQNHSAKP